MREQIMPSVFLEEQKNYWNSIVLKILHEIFFV